MEWSPAEEKWQKRRGGRGGLIGGGVGGINIIRYGIGDNRSSFRVDGWGKQASGGVMVEARGQRLAEGNVGAAGA